MFPVKNKTGVFICSNCDGIIADHIYLGESYDLALPFFSKTAAASERYFDLTCLSSKGLTRRHGWIDRETGMITQTG